MMTLSEVKSSVSEFLDVALKAFVTCDLNNRRFIGDFHKIASDYMYHMRKNGHIKDHQISVRPIEAFDRGLGYDIFIKVWLHDSDPVFQIKYTYDQANYRLNAAYERAMSVV